LAFSVFAARQPSNRGMHGAQLLDVAIDLGQIQVDQEIRRRFVLDVADALNEILVPLFVSLL
jgi:hypothetical protein